jgi:hypothetical protein
MQQLNVDYNSFEGFEIEGPHVATVCENVAARDGASGWFGMQACAG